MRNVTEHVNRTGSALLLFVFAVFFIATAPAGAETFQAGGLTFDAPADWRRETPRSPMRKAQFRIPNAGDAPDGSCIFFHFGPGRGGSAEANIERWRRQFAEPAARDAAIVDVREIAGRRLHYFRASGTFLSGMPGGPKTAVAGTTLLGAILESADGNVFVRLVAPDALAERQRMAFGNMVEDALRR